MYGETYGVSHDSWGMNVKQGTTLYLCLEDSTLRIQNRLYEITEDAPADVHFSTESDILGKGLEQQLHRTLNSKTPQAFEGNFQSNFVEK